MRISTPALALLLCAAVSGNSAFAKEETGRWRLPSNLAQWCGVGYGPGYHAPMIRSPGSPTLQVEQLVFVPKECGPFGCSDFRPAYLGPPGAPGACGFGLPCRPAGVGPTGAEPMPPMTYTPSQQRSRVTQHKRQPSTETESAKRVPSPDNLWWR